MVGAFQYLKRLPTAFFFIPHFGAKPAGRGGLEPM